MPNLSEVVTNKLETGKALEDLNRIFFSTNQNSEEDVYRLGNHAAYPLSWQSTDYLNSYDNDFFVPSQMNIWESTIDKSISSTNNFPSFAAEHNNFANVFQPINSVHAIPKFSNTVRTNECGISRKKYPIRCRHCSFILPTLYDRKRHEELSHGSFLLICDTCNRKFHSKEVLTKHIYSSKCAPPSSLIYNSDKCTPSFR
ncbi:unnamed protein product [Auanema sp. JU1783]|nr:unnamed protein product [Auanema sp. JU1783]